MPLHRAIDISYYEELGVEQNASQAQIRESFRALVRLLHPDQHTDPELKLIAERQLRRINGVYAVLSDPEKRRRYDADTEEEYSSPTRVFNPSSNIDPRRFILRLLWVCATVILAVACTWWYFDSSEPANLVAVDRASNANHGAALPNATAREVAALELAQLEALRSELRNARRERDSALAELNRLKARPSRGASHAPEATPAPPPPTAPAAVAEPAPELRVQLPRVPGASVPLPAKPLGSDPHQYAGFWFFAAGAERTNKNLYPPQFIEAILTEHNGVIHGRYRSRYRVVDRAISPDVNFEFTGTAIGASMKTPWTGLGGARGEVMLSLTGENSLKFDWTASELGTTQGLGSGTATLTRRIE